MRRQVAPLSRCLAVSLTLLLTLFAPRTRAQEATACNITFKVWVDPYYGVDGTLVLTPPSGGWCAGPAFGGSMAALQQLNDPTQPFKTIQRAIDAVHRALIAAYCASPHDDEGVVFALPGVYGEVPVGGQGEEFPIRMRDRVHVKGLNARACVIRGGNETLPIPTVTTIWPLLQSPGIPGCAAGREFKVVLVDYSSSGEFKNAPGIGILDLPWAGTGNTAELLDGFTFQGGDVQVYFGQLIPYRWPLRGRVTNCLFDMRHDPVVEPLPSTVRGPWIGLLMGKEFESWTGNCTAPAAGETGYFDQKVLIANNTFLLAECRPAQEWVNIARPESVAIIDVTAPGSFVDTDNTNRGVGNPVIANNLFRTAPDAGWPRPFAMLGIDISDTTTSSLAPVFTAPTNVFAVGRVGSDNGFFASVPVTSISQGAAAGMPWHEVFDCKAPACVNGFPPCTGICTPATLPYPVIELFDGSPAGTVDPGFVGEWLAPQLSSPPTTAYNDFRLMPGSPLEDLGLVPAGAANGTAFVEPGCQEIRSFTFDHEGWGNPRVVNGRPDVGFDERHGLIMAGSFGNETISHSAAPAGIQPNATQGRARRVFILPATTVSFVTLYGIVVAPATPSPNAWSHSPPGGLNPPIVDTAALQTDYRTQYVSFNWRCPSPTPWPTGGAVVPPQTPWVSPAGPGLAGGSCRIIDGIDNAGGGDMEGTSPIPPCNQLDAPRYFCLQAIQHTLQADPGASKFWYSNLQFEYR